MDIIISTAELRSALSRAQGITNGKTGTLPVLSAVLLDASITPEGGRLTVRAYDLEIGVCSQHSCEIKKPGAVAVPSKALFEITKVLPEMSVRLKVAANNRVEITSGASSFKLAGLSAEDFPAMPTPEALSYEQVERAALRDALEAVAFAMSSDETRYNLNGIFIDPTVNGVNLVATDGHRMALYELKDDRRYGLKEGGGVILGRKAVNELKRLLGEETASPAEMAFNDNSLSYRRAGLTFIARLVDGQFPAYGQVLPKESDKPVFADRAHLSEVLKRVLLMAQDVASAVTVSLEGSKVTLSTRHAEVGEASDSMPVEYAGAPLKIAVNGRYVQDMLATAEGDKLVLSITGDMEPVRMRPVGNEAHVYVVMPVRA